MPKIFKQGIKLIQWTWARAELHRTMGSHTDMYCQQLMYLVGSLGSMELVKSSKVIADKLQNIYLEHRPPHVVQSNQGGEFEGTIKRL